MTLTSNNFFSSIDKHPRGTNNDQSIRVACNYQSDTAMLSKVVAEILHRIILGVWKDEPIGSAAEVGDEAAVEAVA